MSKTVNNLVARDLNDSVPLVERSTITNLALAGTINVRDSLK